MAQVTLYLDDETHTLVKEAAGNEGVSLSSWVARLIRDHTHRTWPQGWHALLGRFPDFPLRPDQPSAADSDRVGF